MPALENGTAVNAIRRVSSAMAQMREKRICASKAGRAHRRRQQRQDGDPAQHDLQRDAEQGEEA
jgi:hypothetical protein